MKKVEKNGDKKVGGKKKNGGKKKCWAHTY